MRPNPEKTLKDTYALLSEAISDLVSKTYKRVEAMPVRGVPEFDYAAEMRARAEALKTLVEAATALRELL